MIGSLPETNEIEPNDSIAQPQTMSEFAKPPRDAEVVINGVLQERGDVDCFAVELKQGQTLVAAVEANEAFGSPLDGILQIVDPDGTTLAENHDSVGLDPRLVLYLTRGRPIHRQDVCISRAAKSADSLPRRC